MITLDVSDSMTKTDLQPSRLAAAVDAAERFVDAAPEDTVDRRDDLRRPRLGAARARPPTATTIRTGARRASASTREGTALGEAVTSSLAALQADGRGRRPAARRPVRLAGPHPGAHRRRQLDPASATSPDAAAERAAAAGVPVYTILLGDDPGRPDQPLPAETLSAMATRTGGIFAQSTTTADLRAVFADIGSIVAPVDELRELTVWAAGIAIALLALAALLAGLSRPRPPRATPARVS